MGDLQIVIAALFVSAAGLNALANWVEVPYPIPLVLGGLVLGLLPGMPEVVLDPDLVLLVFLPPLLETPRTTFQKMLSMTSVGATRLVDLPTNTTPPCSAVGTANIF